MSEKPKALHVFGAEIVGQAIRGAVITQKRGVPVLQELTTFPFPVEEAGDVKPLYIEQNESVRKITKYNLVATAMASNDVLIRSLEIGVKKKKDIDAVLAFQAEPLLPYPVENALLDRLILDQSADGFQLTVLAARKDRLESFLALWRSRGIEPEVVSCAPAALAAFSSLVCPSEKPFFVVHISYTQTICVLVKSGTLLASQVCGKNLRSLEDAFTADKMALGEQEETLFIQMGWGIKEMQKFSALSAVAEQLVLELTRTLFALGKQNKWMDIPDVLITGDCAANYDFIFYLGQKLGKKIITPDVPANFKAPLPQVLSFAVPIGAALSCLPGSQESVNFRQGDLAYPDPWKRLKKPLSLYAGLCLALAGAFYFFGEAYLGHVEDDVRGEYSQLLRVVQKPHSEWEAKISTSGEESVLTLKNLDMQQLTERVALLEKELRAMPDVFPLFPNTLAVSDVLAWINSQPTVMAIDAKTGKMSSLIQIDMFSYTMVKRPEIAKKNERYQVKVEMEFTTPSPKEAREFHDALIAPNQVIDPKGEVKWSTNRGKYRASFYLKDKTIYPTN